MDVMNMEKGQEFSQNKTDVVEFIKDVVIQNDTNINRP